MKAWQLVHVLDTRRLLRARRGLLAHGLAVVVAACFIGGAPNLDERTPDVMPQGKSTIEQVKDQHQTELLSIEGVEGVGIGEEEDRPVIKVYVSDPSRELKGRIPAELEGYPVRIETTGEFNILPAGGP